MTGTSSEKSPKCTINIRYQQNININKSNILATIFHLLFQIFITDLKLATLKTLM